MIPRYIYSYPDLVSKTCQTDCIIVGGGIAGLYTALALPSSCRITLITKAGLEDSNTFQAQGGIAAVLSEQDSAALHFQDTCLAGAGLCEPDIVKMLVDEGPERVRDLIAYGVQFDQEQGQISLTREGAHSQRRILHANGDATGAEIVRGLAQRVRQQNHITILEHTYSLDIRTEAGVCTGIYILTSQDEIHLLEASAVILATGGMGQLYRNTTNPEVATGDGQALAFRAGAELQDMEFIQFHPTVLTQAQTPCFLISEAVRGEGAVLRNRKGQRFMRQYHELGELAPRDIVSRAIIEEMERTEHYCVYIDITHEPEERLQARFPKIYHTLKKYGLNIAEDWIPVAPAAHYAMGGVRTDEHGQTNIKRLYACGEVSSTGVHGANRLASNSLTEAIVFGYRIAQHIQQTIDLSGLERAVCFKEQVKLPEQSVQFDKENWLGSERENIWRAGTENKLIEADQGEEPLCTKIARLRQSMDSYAGVLREGSTLHKLFTQLRTEWHSLIITKSKKQTGNKLSRQEAIWMNMLLCSILITQSALLRKESRGGHYRLDYPNSDDASLAHTVLFRDEGTGYIKESWKDVKR